MWGFSTFLTKRDAWAGTFEQVFRERASPRTDCPTTLVNHPRIPIERLEEEQNYAPHSLQQEHIMLARTLETEPIHRSPKDALEHRQKVLDHMTDEDVMRLAAFPAAFQTQLEAGMYVKRQFEEYLRRARVEAM